MPLLIDAGFDLKLQTPLSNREEAQVFLSNQPQQFSVPGYTTQHGYRLLISRKVAHADGECQTICLLADGIDDGEEYSEIVYKVKVLVRTAPNAFLNITNATQLIVWRTLHPSHSRVLNGFASMIFAHLLESHNIMITDEEQTEAGRRFWLTRMYDAFDNPEHFVQYVDLNELDDNMAPIVHVIKSEDELIKNFYEKGWGHDDEHKGRAFIISKGSLTQ